MGRWTDGDAVLPLPAMHGVTMLEIHLHGTLDYVVSARVQAARRPDSRWRTGFHRSFHQPAYLLWNQNGCESVATETNVEALGAFLVLADWAGSAGRWFLHRGSLSGATNV